MVGFFLLFLLAAEGLAEEAVEHLGDAEIEGVLGFFFFGFVCGGCVVLFVSVFFAHVRFWDVGETEGGDIGEGLGNLAVGADNGLHFVGKSEPQYFVAGEPAGFLHHGDHLFLGFPAAGSVEVGGDSVNGDEVFGVLGEAFYGFAEVVFVHLPILVNVVGALVRKVEARGVKYDSLRSEGEQCGSGGYKRHEVASDVAVFAERLLDSEGVGDVTAVGRYINPHGASLQLAEAFKDVSGGTCAPAYLLVDDDVVVHFFFIYFCEAKVYFRAQNTKDTFSRFPVSRTSPIHLHSVHFINEAVADGSERTGASE